MNIDMIIDKIVDAGLSGKGLRYDVDRGNVILYAGIDPVFYVNDRNTNSGPTTIADAVAYVRQYNHHGLTYTFIRNAGWVSQPIWR